MKATDNPANKWQAQRDVEAAFGDAVNERREGEIINKDD